MWKQITFFRSLRKVEIDNRQEIIVTGGFVYLVCMKLEIKININLESNNLPIEKSDW